MSTPPNSNLPQGEKRSAGQESSSKRSVIVQAAKYSHVAIALPAAVFIGWLFGTLLDRWLHTSWIYILGVILGIIAGFVELARAAMMASKE